MGEPGVVIEKLMPDDPAAALPLPCEDLFSRSVLSKAIMLITSLPESAMGVLATKEAVKPGMPNNPEVCKKWRGRSVMKDLHDFDYGDWFKDGGVQVHPKYGKVLAVTIKWVVDQKEWTLPEGPDGGTGGCRVKTGLALSIAHQCVVLVWKKKPHSRYDAAKQGWLTIFTSEASARRPPEMFRTS